MGELVDRDTTCFACPANRGRCCKERSNSGLSRKPVTKILRGCPSSRAPGPGRCKIHFAADSAFFSGSAFFFTPPLLRPPRSAFVSCGSFDAPTPIVCPGGGTPGGGFPPTPPPLPPPRRIAS